MATSFYLSFLTSPLSTTTKTTTAPPPRRRLVISCATTSPAKKKHWKVGEYPGFSEISAPRFSTDKKNNKTPNKNIKKKLDKKNNAKGWVSTVTESLSEAIQNKQWLRALQVTYLFPSQFHFSSIRFSNLG